MIVDGVVYVTTSERFIYPFVAGSCSTKPANRQFQYDFPGGVTAAPVVVGDLMVVPNGSNLVAIDLTSADRGASLWIFPSGALIQSSPVVAGDTIYFGNNSGTVFAVALNSDDPQGELLWSWKTGSSVVSSVAVLDGVVFVTSTNGIVYAIGESAEAATTDTTVPDTTVPGTTVPGTTVPGTTEPDTTEPDTTTTTLVPPVEVGGTL
jgi:serine/threonine-protein kinase